MGKGKLAPSGMKIHLLKMERLIESTIHCEALGHAP
eukprot:CAMPEP_0114687894 /NCGR_PEP_ID=MMETSP0191-20121206/62955_1 /TAXON_ID=126664 /ORGANISM="Sorites sp." /LENGTH=35 /DNA_ID= /DNA_START= /DNA_END= /DNA_ORIENTATION=